MNQRKSWGVKMKIKENEAEGKEGNESSPDTDQIVKLEAEIDSLKQKNSWLTEESKKNVGKYKNLRDSVGENEKAALEKTGKFQELYELAKQEKESLVEKNRELNDSLLDSKLIDLCREHASDAHDVRDILAQRGQRELLKIDEKGDITGMKEFVAAVKKEKPHLFKSSKAASFVNDHPQFKSGELRPVEEMGLDELKSILKKTVVTT